MSNQNSKTPLRQCLGRFATGVTVVTCKDAEGQPRGLTANSFSSVSLEPPLVLWNIGKTSNSLRAFLDARHFAFHILRSDQEALSTHFARTDVPLFDGVDYTDSDHGVPILPDCMAVLQCTTRDIHDCGDHYIIVGHLDDFDLRDGEPLLFFRGEYREIKPA